MNSFLAAIKPQLLKDDFPYDLDTRKVSYDTLYTLETHLPGTEEDTLQILHKKETNHKVIIDTTLRQEYYPLLHIPGYRIYTGHYEDGYADPEQFEGWVHEVLQKEIEDTYLRLYEKHMDRTNPQQLYEYALICLGYFARVNHIPDEKIGIATLRKLTDENYPNSRTAQKALIDFYQWRKYDPTTAEQLRAEFHLTKKAVI